MLDVTLWLDKSPEYNVTTRRLHAQSARTQVTLVPVAGGNGLHLIGHPDDVAVLGRRLIEAAREAAREMDLPVPSWMPPAEAEVSAK